MVRGMPARALEPEPDDEEAVLFQAFLIGDAGARETLPPRFKGLLSAMANRMGADLPPDQREEAVNETWAILLEGRGNGFDPRRGRVSTYVAQVMRDAIRRVRASYAPPGQRTRLPNRTEPEVADGGDM